MNYSKLFEKAGGGEMTDEGADPANIYAYHEELMQLTDELLKFRHAREEQEGNGIAAVLCLIEADHRGLYIKEAPGVAK